MYIHPSEHAPDAASGRGMLWPFGNSARFAFRGHNRGCGIRVQVSGPMRCGFSVLVKVLGLGFRL